MGWDIRVWHEEVGERTRLTIEAGVDVPEDVIARIAGAYWLDEIQFADGDWEEDPESPDVPPALGNKLQG